MKRVFLPAILMILVSFSIYAQQDPIISQYMFNYQIVNPAYAGTKDYGMADALFRTQWVGLSGSPTTALVSINGPVFASRKVGLGLWLSQDNIGLTDRSTIMGDYAYHIPIKNDIKLSIGLNGGIFYQHSNLSDATLTDPNGATDKVYSPGTTNKIAPEVGAGAYLYNDKFYIGLSVPEIISYDNSRPVSISSSSIYSFVRQYWATGGFAIEVSPDFVIRPSVMLRYADVVPLSADINCNVLIKKFLWLGVTYRTGDATEGIGNNSFVGIVEILITKQLRIGYSYDFNTSPLNQYSSGSHEITLGYDFGYDVLKMKSPRYF